MKRKSKKVAIVFISLIIIFIITLVIINLIFYVQNNSKSVETSKRLIEAIRNDDLQLVSEIVEQHPESVNTLSGSRSLRWWAVITEQPEIEYPLQTACIWGNYDIIKILVENGADCNLVDKYGTWSTRTPLINAVIYNNESTMDIVKLLLDNGAEKSYKDVFGKTAYDYAVDKGLSEIAELLKP